VNEPDTIYIVAWRPLRFSGSEHEDLSPVAAFYESLPARTFVEKHSARAGQFLDILKLPIHETCPSCRGFGHHREPGPSCSSLYDTCELCDGNGSIGWSVVVG